MPSSRCRRFFRGRISEWPGIAAQVPARMPFFLNGYYPSTSWLAGRRGALEAGIAQVTGMLANPGVN